MPALLAAVALVGLAGCARTLATPPRSNDLVAATDSLVDMPVGGPQIVAVIDQSAPTQMAQRILLYTASDTYGQNSLEIKTAGVSDDLGDPMVAGVTPTVIRTELRNLFPTIPMGVSNAFVQNDYGPFGYAVGKAESGDTCLYAWQFIRGSHTIQAEPTGGIVSLRLRLCDARASADDLLLVMYGFTLKAAVPVVAPLLRPEIGRSAAPVYAVPLGAQPPPATNVVIGRQPAAVVPAPYHPPVVVAAPVAPPAPIAPLPGYPAVPLPPGAVGTPLPLAPGPATADITVPLPP